MILQLRRGPSPNCSSHGSVVGLALLSAAGTAVVLNVWAERFTRWVRSQSEPGGDAHSGETGAPTAPQPVYREEDGKVLLSWPDGQLLLDGEHAEQARAARRVGLERVVPGALSAPIEAHLSLTERCPVACTGCYVGASPQGQPAQGVAQALDELAEMGVLQVAFGGGEVLTEPTLLPLLERCRALGMTPNFTTSGFGLTPDLAQSLAPLVGQVNVSLDGLGVTYAKARGWSGAQLGLDAIQTLRDAGVSVGVNTVLTRPLWEDEAAIRSLQSELVQRGVREWQWLRFKPSGRGKSSYRALAPTLDPELLLLRLLAAEVAGLRMRIDCALVPFLPSLDTGRLQRLGVAGCPGGHSLLTRSAEGEWSPCSFMPGATALDWEHDPTLLSWRAAAAEPAQPCTSCERRAVCRGGCRVVSHFLTGDPLAPDPECPTVLAHRATT